MLAVTNMTQTRSSARLRALALLTTAAAIALTAGCMSDDSNEGALVDDRASKGLPDPPCKGDFREVAGLGIACRLEDGIGWKVRLDDGTTVTTHGQDPEQVVPSLEAIPQRGNYRAPLCTNQNPKGNYHFVAIIAWPSGVTPDMGAGDFRLKIYAANHLIDQAAVKSGSPGADLVFACDTNGFPRVDLVPLSITQSAATFGGIISELRSKGFNKQHEKYVIWYDAPIPPTPPLTVVPCGEATGNIFNNSTPGVSNPNNSGPSYGISYDCDAMLHELSHNIGAVQRNAPHPSYYHCWEEEDVMCYNDGYLEPPGQQLVVNCPKPDSFDCNYDDYFDAAIGAGQGKGPGSYLDTNWNLGACYVRYIVNHLNACRPVMPQLFIEFKPQYFSRRRLVQLTAAANPESSRATQFIVFRDNHPVGRFEGEPGTELEFVDEEKLVPGETYEYRIVGLDAEGEFDSNSNVEQVTISD